MEDTTIVAEEETQEEVQEEIQEENQEEQEVVEEVEEETSKKKPGYQERINEITRARRQAERDAKTKAEEAEYWKNLALQNKSPEASPLSDGRPRQEQFETVEEYEDAVFDWRDEQRIAKAKKENEAKAQEEALGVFNKNAAKMRAQYEDFDEVMETPVFTDTMRKALLTLDNGPMIAYHIGSNPEVADAIIKLSPERQIYEMAKIERDVLLARNTKKKTDAQPPLNPVNGTAVAEKDPSKMSTDEWMEWDKQNRLAKIKKNLGG